MCVEEAKGMVAIRGEGHDAAVPAKLNTTPTAAPAHAELPWPFCMLPPVFPVLFMFSFPPLLLGTDAWLLYASLVKGSWAAGATLAGLTLLMLLDPAPSNGEGRPVHWVRHSALHALSRIYYRHEVIEETARTTDDDDGDDDDDQDEDADAKTVAGLSEKDSYLFAMHPHGMIGCAVWLLMLTNGGRFLRSRDVRVPTVSGNFQLPLWNWFMLAFGFVDADRKSCDRVLSTPGRSLAIAIGGAVESLDAHPGTYDLTINKRKGFVKLALKHGTPIVPVFTFGENHTYTQWSNPRGSFLRSVQDRLLKVLKFATPILFGRGIFQKRFGIMPRPAKLTSIVGPPVSVQVTAADRAAARGEQCDDEDNDDNEDAHATAEDGQVDDEAVEIVHARYCKALRELFDRHKDTYAKDCEHGLRFVA